MYRRGVGKLLQQATLHLEQSAVSGAAGEQIITTALSRGFHHGPSLQPSAGSIVGNWKRLAGITAQRAIGGKGLQVRRGEGGCGSGRAPLLLLWLRRARLLGCAPAQQQRRLTALASVQTHYHLHAYTPGSLPSSRPEACSSSVWWQARLLQ